jgi:alkylresorcinol/alkylpyrone synthase
MVVSPTSTSRLLTPVPVQLLSVATAVPASVISQADACVLAQNLFAARYPDFTRLSAVFETSGIQKRHSARPLDWYRTQRGWPERTAVYLEVAGALFEEAASEALTRANLRASDIDAIVTASSTGIATPSLDVRSFERMGFASSTRRIPVFGLGCAGGVSGLSIAADIARGRPGRNVLFVAVELCTLSLRHDLLSKANIVATALFGDGAGACILRAPGAGERATSGHANITLTGEHAWPDTIDLMGWNVDPEGFGVIFARAIPPFARANMGAAVSSMLATGDLTIPAIDRFICHPGGARVVDALEESLGLPAQSLDHEREILTNYGNMSAPTVLFVLERMVAAGLPHRAALLAMGPGFTASCAVLERAA